MNNSNEYSLMSDDNAEIIQAKFACLHALSRGQFDAETKVLGVTKIYLNLADKKTTITHWFK